MPETPKNTYLNFITAHEGIIHKVVGLYAEGKQDREDLYKEILLQSWRSYGNFQAKAQFSTWLYRVALNTALNYHRKKRKTENLETVQQVLIDKQTDTSDTEILYHVIRSLGEVDRMLITLHLDGYKNGEIAEITGMTTNHINVKLHRIRAIITNKFKVIHNEE